MSGKHGSLFLVRSHFALAIGVLFLSSLAYPITAEEHAKHHPGAGAGAGSSMASGAPGGPGGGMMAGMGEMMKEMGKPKTKEFYPSLMDLPKLTQKQREELQSRAHERMKSGTALMNRGIVDLTHAAEANDYRGMEKATALIHEGLAQFESGVATHRALAEGKTPQQIGLDWFKRNLSLEEAAPDGSADKGILGVSPFHLFLMVFLVLFAAGVIGMYFFKMKRAAKLLERLGSGVVAQATPLGSVNTTAIAPAVGSAEQVVRSSAPEHGPAQDKPARWKGKLKLADVYTETPSVKTFRFVNPEGGDLPFTYQAGQFLTLGVMVEGKPVKRSYTIASHPCERGAIELTVKREDHGLVSRYMHDVVRTGDLLDVEAAYGNLTFAGLEERPMVLIGGGVGLTPLMSVIRCMISCGMKNPIYLLYACKTLSDFVFRDELEYLRKRHPNLNLVVAVDHLEGQFLGAFEGRLTKEVIEKSVADIAKARIHLCGPPPMMQAVRKALSELHVPEEQIKTEAFGPAGAPTKAAAPIVAPPSPPMQAVKTVTFKKAGKTAPIAPEKTVLEAAEEAGVDIPFSCRVGTCGTCKVKLLSGEVDMEVQEGLTEEEKKQGLILACQAKAKTSLEIEEL